MKFIIFDLDDTLLCGDCEREWLNFLFLKGLIKDPKSKLDQFDQSYRKGNLSFEKYSNFIQSPIIGMTKARVDSYVNEFIQKNINNLTDKLTSELLNEADSADKVLIASGSHDYLVDGFANFFKIDSGIGTSTKLKNNNSMRKKMGLNAINTYKKMFTFNKYKKNVNSILKQL